MSPKRFEPPPQFTGTGLKEAWTYVEASPLAPYYGTPETGLWLPLEGEPPLALTPTMIKTLVATWRGGRVNIGPPSEECAPLDDWQAGCDEIFRRAMEHQLGHAVSARAAVSLMGALVGEGVVQDHSCEPTIAELAALESLHGRFSIYGSRGRFCTATIERIRVRGGGSTELGFRKNQDLRKGGLPDELPAGSDLSTFLTLIERGHVFSGWGLFEIMIDQALIADVVAFARTSTDEPSFLRRVRSRQRGLPLDIADP
jgi:hypothetical protein